MLNTPTPDKSTVYAIIKTLGREIWSSSETPAGLLVTLSGESTTTDVTAEMGGPF